MYVYCSVTLQYQAPAQEQPIFCSNCALKTVPNKAKSISAELLELYLKNKLEETKKIGKKREETGINGNKLEQTGRTGIKFCHI